MVKLLRYDFILQENALKKSGQDIGGKFNGVDIIMKPILSIRKLPTTPWIAMKRLENSKLK